LTGAHNRVGGKQGHRPLRRHGDGVAAGIRCQHGEVERVVLGFGCEVEPCQQQQVLDERSHAGGLVLDTPHDRGLVDVLVVDPEAKELGEALNRGQRRAQLMGRVRQEAAQTLLVLLPLCEGLLHVGERTGGAAQDGTDALDELLDAEGFRDVVVHAELEALHLVGGGVLGSEKDDGYPSAGALGLAEASSHLEAVEIGQHHVQHDEVGAPSLDLGQSVAAGCQTHDVEAVDGQPERDQLGDVLLVVDGEHDGLCNVGHEVCRRTFLPARSGLAPGKIIARGIRVMSLPLHRRGLAVIDSSGVLERSYTVAPVEGDLWHELGDVHLVLP
jgi:hypothetical protein